MSNRHLDKYDRRVVAVLVVLLFLFVSGYAVSKNNGFLTGIAIVVAFTVVAAVSQRNKND